MNLLSFAPNILSSVSSGVAGFLLNILNIRALKPVTQRIDRAFYLTLQVVLHIFLLNGWNVPRAVNRAAGIIGTTLGNDFFLRDSEVETRWKNVQDKYDYIVIGGGLAGCIVANRLSRNYTTLLIHGPGGVPTDVTRIPMLSMINLGDDVYDWLYESLDSAENIRYKDGKYYFNNGKQLGGSQTLSGHIWSGGKSGDFEEWKRLGAKGFSREILYKAMRRITKRQFDEGTGTKYEDYGDNGEVFVSHPDLGPGTDEIAMSFIKTGADMTGVAILNDSNTDVLSFGRVIQATDKYTGYPSNAVRAFIEPLRKSGSMTKISNKLDILLHSMVTKINFEKIGNKITAVSVDVTRNEDGFVQRKTISANRRIIVSAGSTRSPQLLMVSGVGDEDILKKFNIKPILHKPGVGRNLHDHPILGSAAACFPNGKGFTDLGLTDNLKFIHDRSGVLRSTTCALALGFFTSANQSLSTCPDRNDKQNCRPDFEILFHQLAYNNQIGSMILRGLQANEADIVKYFYLQNKNRDEVNKLNPISKYRETYFNQMQCMTYTTSLLHPQFRGNIVLTGNSIFDKPKLNISLLGTDRDRQLLVELHLMLEKITNEAFRNTSKRGEFMDSHFEDCDQMKEQEAKARCIVEKYIHTEMHQGGTCTIGHVDDPMAVVDSNFSVIGISNLSVVDASVFPSTVSGHMLLTIASVAEKAACMLLEEANGVACELRGDH